MKKQTTPLGTIIGRAFVEAMEETGDLSDTVREILEEPEIKEELRNIIRDYLSSDAGRKYIVDLMDQEDVFGEAMGCVEIQDILNEMVIKKLKA